MELVADQVATDLLEDRPSEAADDGARDECSPAGARWRQDLERQEVGADVDDDLCDEDRQRQDGRELAQVAARRERRSGRGQDDRGRYHAQEQQASCSALEHVGLFEAGATPQAVRRRLEGRGDAEGAPEEEQGGDDGGERVAAAQGVDVGGETCPDHGELFEGRVDEALGRLGVWAEQPAGDRAEEQQEREDRQQAVERDQGGVHATSVVAVALDDPDADRTHTEASLEPIDDVDEPLPLRRHRGHQLADGERAMATR